MSKTLVVLNDAPYGTERSYNAEAIKVLLIGDAAACAKAHQRAPRAITTSS